MTSRRDFIRKLALGGASLLLAADAAHDFMAWEQRRVFALGPLRQRITALDMDGRQYRFDTPVVIDEGTGVCYWAGARGITLVSTDRGGATHIHRPVTYPIADSWDRDADGVVFPKPQHLVMDSAVTGPQWLVIGTSPPPYA